MLPEEDPEALESELRGLIEGAARNYDGITVAIRRILLARPLLPPAGGERLVEPLAARASKVMGAPVGATGVPLSTDARPYTAAGIPTAHGRESWRDRGCPFVSISVVALHINK